MYILIVTGMSGAGKSNALRALEDMGYLCVDNLPCDLLSSFVELCRETEPHIERVALAIDSRTSVFRHSSDRLLQAAEALKEPYEMLFLDCSNEVLQRRYGETRRRHPMHEDAAAGILIERELLNSLKERANYIIDTTDMKPRELQQELESMLSSGGAMPFRLKITSFGYKRGIPRNADIVMDMRYTANPFYETSLRNLSGKDEPVRDYVFADANVRAHLDSITESLKMLIPAYMGEGKRRLIVAFGCTGGRHRSVAMAEALFERMRSFCPATIEHRDLIYEANDITSRFNS